MQGFSRNLIVLVLMALLVFALVGCSTSPSVEPLSPMSVPVPPEPVRMPIPGLAEPIPPVPAP